jgi:hypothetical protein
MPHEKTLSVAYDDTINVSQHISSLSHPEECPHCHCYSHFLSLSPKLQDFWPLKSVLAMTVPAFLVFPIRGLGLPSGDRAGEDIPAGGDESADEVECGEQAAKAREARLAKEEKVPNVL